MTFHGMGMDFSGTTHSVSAFPLADIPGTLLDRLLGVVFLGATFDPFCHTYVSVACAVFWSDDS